MTEDKSRHPAYGFIRMSRVNGGSGRLFMSPLRHENRISITIGEAEQVRSLSTDAHYAGRQIIEVQMSEAQFAQFITNSMNHAGAPCTITSNNGKMIPPLDDVQLKSDQYYKEAQKMAEDAIAAVADARQKIGPKPQVAKQIALTLFGELQAARKRCNPAVKLDPLKASGTHTAEIERCLRSGVTPDQIRHVIACWEALVKSGKREREHFNSVTPFRASNVAQYIEMTLEDAAKPRPGYVKQPASPEKPKPQAKEPSEWEKRRDAFLREQQEKSKETENNS